MTEIDMDAYNSSEDKIKPGQHEEFTIHPTIHSFQEFTAQPDVPDQGFGKKAEGMKNETGWMMNPTFEERFSGAQPMPESPPMDPDALEGNWIQHGRATPKGWTANQFPQFSPTLDSGDTQAGKDFRKYVVPQSNNPRYPDLRWQVKPPFGGVYDEQGYQVPYDPDKPEVYNFPISMKDEPPKMFPENIIPMPKDMKAQHQESIGGYAQQGMSIRQIAKEMDLHPSKVQRILKTLGIQTTGKSDTRFGAENANPGGPGGSKPGEKRGAAKGTGPDWFKEEMEQTLEKELKMKTPQQQQQGKPPIRLRDMNPDVLETKMRKVLTENPELRQSPFSPDNQKEVDEWVKSLHIDDYYKMLEGKLKPPEPK